MINQKELLSRVRASLAYKYKLTEIDQIIKCTVATVLDATSNGEEVSINGLGKFYGRFIKGKQIKKTGIPWLQNKEFSIPDRYHLGFAPSDSANRTVSSLINKVEKDEISDEQRLNNL